MSFSEKWDLELKKGLSEEFVKSRVQGSSSVPYIESHHSIREANTIFGYGEWSYQIDQLICVHTETKEAKRGGENHYISYTATVTVTVNGTVRQDVGFGQGIGRDCGQAHESATKEAVSDALKRALRTFGDRFGLALYDKQRKHVVPEGYGDAITEIESLINAKEIELCRNRIKFYLSKRIIKQDDAIIAQAAEVFKEAS